MAAGGMDRMRSAMNTLDDANQSLLTDIGSSLIMFKMVAEDLEAEKQTKMVEDVENSTKEILELMEDFECYNKALQHLKENYSIRDESTDFEKILSEYSDHLKTQSAFKMEEHILYRQFKEAIWKVNHASEPMPGQEKDDLIIMCTQYNVVNTHCPLSGKPIVELDDPVRSLDCMHIYDRSAVMNYIKNWKNTRRPCPCAAAGCPKPLVKERIVCDAMLKVDIQECRMRGRVNTQVADCTELDDEVDEEVDEEADNEDDD